jgi:hypothetical protein
VAIKIISYNLKIKENMFRKIFTVALSFVLFASVSVAQDFNTLSRKEAKKLEKAAKKEAKKLSKEGWIVSPGSLTLEAQLAKSYKMLSEVDENYYPRFYMAEAMSIGENYDAAKMQALELAKQNLAGQIQTEVTSIIESTVANTQLEAEEAASVVETVSASKNVIAQSLGRVIVVTETYRVLSNKNREVLVRIAYNAEAAKKQAKVAIKQELQEKGNQLHQQLDNLLGF